MRKSGRPKKRPDIEEFYYYYDNKTYPIEDLCKRWKVKKQTIYQWSTYYRKILRGGVKRKKEPA